MTADENVHRDGIAARVVDHLLPVAGGVQVADVRIGLGYTAVLLEDGRAGLAYTFREAATHGCSVRTGQRPLVMRPAADLLELSTSADPIEAGIGIACANALANRADREFCDGDVLEQLDLRAEDHVGMVGHFGPLVDPIRERARALTVFDEAGDPAGTTRPAAEAEAVLPSCQVALITATAIINHSIDRLLVAVAGCREVVVLGASTPLLPEVFRETGITLLSGVIVSEPGEILRVVSEGGGMRLFRRYVRKVSLRRV